MLYRDAPTVEVSTLIEGATVDQVWDLVTDITLPTRAAGELESTEWVGDPGVAVGARFRGTNTAEHLGTWVGECEITEVDPGRRWVWQVGPAAGGDPWATWAFEVEPSSKGTIVRQWARLGPGPSRLSEFIQANPAKESRLITHRLTDWRNAMQANLDLIRTTLT
ncbi:SRPBCC family protein [Gordonia sp. (in: high G+C Gram-positive bacteria)]|uniref:SRPBCC family protein n=2 Tax=Gordonia sp. (in: high G+C Gram-positive bacteria) TaxID=84139 RepID=UPI001DB9C1F6|nr:SRPBCC family protein [Gordonia sp. (in: high G+C Gram-positive bacteria)]MCB1295664.1 SRPBCC family protein [Gordonia sp. (in: high G+C Gram-positive bacteria)]HMS75261.1 SRPBCC family protein [Gordonia sp. (in: high G+C Gram-positive bacteria)]